MKQIEPNRSMVWIRGGRLIDPARNLDQLGDVFIQGDRFIELEPRQRERLLAEPGTVTVVDARNKIVTPGLIDMHVHLREPGREDKETIETGAAAAAAGGFTAVACMPNTDPVLDKAELIQWVLERARNGVVHVYPIGAISHGQMGRELAEIGEMVAAGAVALSDDGKSVADAALLRRAFEYAQMFDIPIIEHCEDPNLAADGVMNEGSVATRLGLKGQPSIAEDLIMARDILLAEYTGGHFHAAHVTTAGGVALIRQAKKRGLPVTGEVLPHHFTLTDEAVVGFDTNTKMNPPLRTAVDREAVWQGLADGTIDVIASDHAPHTIDDKQLEYNAAAFGIVGLETALGLTLSQLVRPGVLTLAQAIAKFTVGPARILRLPERSLRPGLKANVSIIDPDVEWRVEPERFRSKGRNTPFGGWILQGRVEMIIVDGRRYRPFEQD